MAWRCNNCLRTYTKVNKRRKTRSKFNPVNTYRQKPNLQYAVLGGKRVKLCTSCYKKLVLAK